jgi:hypothetical protein
VSEARESGRADSSSSSPVFPTTPRARDLDWLCERIAQRTAKLVLDELAEREISPAPGAWTTAARVAEHLGVSIDVVYENADRLGAVRVGGGTKPRLRFQLERVDELLRDTTIRSASRGSDEAQSRTAAPVAPRRGRRLLGTAVDLLPIAGDERPNLGGPSGPPPTEGSTR